MKTTYSAGKELSQEAKTLCLKEQSTDSHSLSQTIILFIPPKIKFETFCFHPNVDLYGNTCLDILQDKWSSAYDVRTILLSIQSLLGEYRKMVEKHYKPLNA